MQYAMVEAEQDQLEHGAWWNMYGGNVVLGKTLEWFNIHV